MPPAHWSEDRWVQNEDGSYRRRKAADGSPGEMYDDYASLTKPELAELLGMRSLPKTGSKAELVARLEEDDAS